MLKEIDLNIDLGEGMKSDAGLMPFISSCSIACGGHYGNESTMNDALELAKKHRVKVGAHPSFPDTDNFGRKNLTITKSELSDTIFHQLIRFYAVCEELNMPINHVKLHGALYNYAAIDAPTADAVVDGIIATGLRPKLYVPFNSILSKKAENLLPLIFEAFIDRRYNDDLSLVSRNDANAIIESPELAWKQLYGMLKDKEVTTLQNNKRIINATTFCIHGDTKNALNIVKFITVQMKNHNIHLSK
jgi:UPF0271 protein